MGKEEKMNTAPTSNQEKSANSTAPKCHLCLEFHEPNQTTIAAMEEVRRGGLEKFETIEELMADLYAND